MWLKIWTVLLLALPGASARADEALFDFKQPPPVVAIDASVSTGKSGETGFLRVETGHEKEWPGITLHAPAGNWDLSAFAQVRVDVKNIDSAPVRLHCRVDNPGADGVNHCVNGDATLAPGQEGAIYVELKRTSGDDLGGKLFGMRGYPVKFGGPGTVDTSNITQILLFVAQPSVKHLFEVRKIEAVGHYTPPTAWTSDAKPFFPFIDTFGQYLRKDWPGKTKSLADLEAKRKAEQAELKHFPGPEHWDRFGGWADGPQLKATGFFGTVKYNGKWWLLDPDGHLFFSDGIDCVGMNESTPVADRAAWFQDFPGRQPAFAQFLFHGFSMMGHYAGHSPESFSFTLANLTRKYGSNLMADYPALVQRRLRSWGINTIGNWSDRRFSSLDLTPYTDSIYSRGARMIEGSEGYWGKFPDVFDPSLAEGMKEAAAWAKGKSAGDPWCIGYFSDNEMSWGDETSIAIAALKSGPDQPAKKVFAADLKKKYLTITALNTAWGTEYASWDALLRERKAPDRKRAKKDLAAFYTKAAEQYFRTAREAVKSVAPRQLYLGCRFAAVNPLAAAAAAKYCDVVSYNIYRHGVAGFKFDGGADVPLLVGEFHFGALDRGLFHPGLVELPDQQARARAYRDYVESALHHPQFVGCHWFQYRDEPVTGRVLDGENYQIGFIDVADTPYAEIVAASRQAGYHLYQ